MKALVAFITVIAIHFLIGCEQREESNPSATEFPVVQVFKTPTCGCCSKWIDHLEANGFTVEATDLDDLQDLKRKNGVPQGSEACHTALVGDYVIEGHVPAQDIVRLLEEKLAVRGLVVPGMPRGSPGMEAPHTDPYSVFLFDETGRGQEFARYH